MISLSFHNIAMLAKTALTFLLIIQASISHEVFLNT